MAVSRKGGNRVGPRLDECGDGVVRVGGDPDLAKINFSWENFAKIKKIQIL
jgi:hypothetical protein